MQNIKDTIQQVMKRLQTRQSNQETEAFRLLKKQLNPRERSHIRCVSLRDGTITVNVDSSAWLYQLNQRKEQLIEQLGIRDIKFRIGEVEPAKKDAFSKRADQR